MTRAKFGLKALTAAVASSLLFSNADAAGLGKLTVLSALGQPLHAEIELTSVAKDEIGKLEPKLASTEAFRQASIDFSPALFSLRFAVEQRSGRQFIRVTSAQPINEPFVDMLLELGGTNGRLVREYTFLLDPADLRSSQSPQIAAPIVLPPAALTKRAPATQPEAPAAKSTPIEQAPAPAEVPKAAEQAAPAEPAASAPAAEKVQQQAVTEPSAEVRPEPAVRVKPTPIALAPKPTKASKPSKSSSSEKKSDEAVEYEVKQGDSLGKIAGQIKPNGVSLDQMLVALYRANPDAFIDNNMNRLRAGEVLNVPNLDGGSSVSNSEAHGIVIAQAADFNSYRKKLAGQVAAAEPQKSVESKQSATGKITAKVEERPTAANESKDKLKLSKAGASAATSASSADNKASSKAAGTEDKIAKEKAIAEADARAKQLEKNIGDLNKVLEVKNKDLAAQQKQADAAKQAAKPATPAPEVKQAEAPKPASASASASVAASTVASVPAAPVTPVTPAAASASASAAASVPASAAASIASTPQTPPIAPPKPKVVVTPKPEPSLVDETLDNPFFLPGIGALVAAFGGLGFYAWRRKKEEGQFSDSLMNDTNLKANSLFGSTGGQSVDTNNSVFNSNFAPSANQLDSNEVDPVAEADVYIAYGRDAQAEEILKEALRTQPDRTAVRVKLLEIYANRKDVRSFETLASELYGMTKGEGEDWKQAAALGLSIDPDNPLYAAGKGAQNQDADLSDLTAATVLVDEPDLDALLAATQMEPALETLNTLDSAAYFGNTNIATEVPEAAPIVEESEKAPEDLDFDLEGIGVELENANTVASLPAVDPKTVLGDVNFDFLDGKNLSDDAAPVTEAPQVDELLEPALDEPLEQPTVTAKAEDPVASTDKPLILDIPELAEPSAETSKPESKADALEFDLSGIALDLNTASASSATETALAEQDASTELVENEDYSNNAEMATKLDLAVAYQEIGDKEGARELLEEVIKGGSTAQIDKAKNLLRKLG